MKVTERKARNEVVRFAKMEFRQKKPLNVKVLRVKDVKKVSIGDALPQRGVKESHDQCYVVLLDYGENYRMYTFTKLGTLINGKTIEKTSDEIHLLERTTKLVYKFKRR